LTRRGRFVLTSLASAPLVIAALAFAINGGGATASLEGSSEPLSYVTVASGQSLWQLAEQLAPQADPREVIAEIVSLNQLGSAELQAGQQLAVPSEYLP
jgi:LysM repeat protein